jgi:NADH-quinone oxidoreductase subunit L
MVWTVWVLAALSIVGGLVQFAPFWHPLTDWLEPVAPSFAEATDRQEVIASVCAVVFGLLGILVARSLYGTRTSDVPRTLPVLENKFYWDELYDFLFYKPAVLVTRAFYRLVEKPLIAGSIGGVTRGFRIGSGEATRVQNGLVRSYALALAGGLAVLAVVFLTNR